ncbi:hypothetical protein ACSBR2_041232 [Camellia fascicularis]
MAAQNSKFKRFSGILRCLLCIGSLPSDPTTDIPTTTTTTDIPTTTTTTTTTQVKTPGVVARLMGLDSLPESKKGYAGNESSYNVSGSDSGSESEVTISTSRKSFHRSNRPRPSSWLSTESFVSTEAKKRLSERWKTSQRYQNVGAVSKASTLDQMLSIRDTEMRPENFYPMTGLDGSSDRFVSNNEIAE